MDEVPSANLLELETKASGDEFKSIEDLDFVFEDHGVKKIHYNLQKELDQFDLIEGKE